MVQSIFIIKNNKITGWVKPYKPRKCNYCGKVFTPTHPHNLYCRDQCRDNSDKEHTEERVRKYRKKYPINDRSILNVGTGGLGGHSCKNFQKEQEKILKELQDLGLR